MTNAIRPTPDAVPVFAAPRRAARAATTPKTASEIPMSPRALIHLG